MTWRKEKKIILSLFIIGILSLNYISYNIQGAIEENIAPNASIDGINKPPIVEIDSTTPYLTTTNFTWTATTIYDRSDLLDTSTGDSFTYSISDEEIFIQEITGYMCYAGVYATVPVTNGYLAYSCYLKASSNHNVPKHCRIYTYNATSYELLDNTPIIFYDNDGSLVTDYNYVAVNMSLPGETEAILFISYRDVYSTNWYQTVRAKDFRVYTGGTLPLSDRPNYPNPMDNYTWTGGNFLEMGDIYTNPAPPLTPRSGSDYSYSVNSTYLHFEETGTDGYDDWVGVYTTLPANNEHLAFSFEAKTKSNILAKPRLDFRLYDPVTKNRILKVPVAGRLTLHTYETDFHYYEFNLTVPGYDEVLVLFYFHDTVAENSEYQFWISNLKVYSTEDSDGDGIPDDDEISLGTNPLDPDTDDDLMPDGWEINNSLNPLVNDSYNDADTDGLYNLDEYTLNVDPQNNDTDSDGLLDGPEVNTHFTNPLVQDSDSDGLTDGEEVNVYSTDPLDPDSDDDGLPDGWEVDNGHDPNVPDSGIDSDSDGLSDLVEYLNNTDPFDADTDDDGLDDGDEVLTYGSDPLDTDSDTDGLLDGEEVHTYSTDPTDIDSDGDGLEDGDEVFIHSTDPADSDTDDDGMPDGYEVNNGLNPEVADDDLDADSDYLSNLDEYLIGTNPQDEDTDNDNLVDGQEVHTTLTDPLDPDSDDDGLEDGEEVFTYFSDPNNPDSDDDGMPDGWEAFYSLNPMDNDSQEDSDGDGATNLEEFNNDCDPTDTDSDGDGMLDGYEIAFGLDPLTDDASEDPDGDGLDNYTESLYYSDPFDTDTDDDGLPDDQEVELTNTNPASNDTDNDGLDDYEEIFTYPTNPLINDTDNDGCFDGWEVDYDFDPMANDSYLDPDEDGLTNYEEYLNGTNPLSADSDGDSFTDLEELEAGSDPNDPLSIPPKKSSFPAIFTLVGLVSLITLRRKKKKL